MQTSKTKLETLIETNKPGFLQEVMENVPRSSTDNVLKSESEVYGEELSKLYGEEPNNFSD